MLQWPRSPRSHPKNLRLLMGIVLIRSAAHLHCHRRSMVGEVSAGTSDAGVIGPRRMHAHCRCLVNKHLTENERIGGSRAQHDLTATARGPIILCTHFYVAKNAETVRLIPGWNVQIT
jgi:hypothetical protein